MQGMIKDKHESYPNKSKSSNQKGIDSSSEDLETILSENWIYQIR